ncbi:MULTISPECIES: histidine phosphatase family protein [unclassified Ketobacter]|jgi:broad specificity phosphatase PhoE|uniref:histidine phosphatase family protein n=1 Tax=unclassified Ketobacter TaxID=2639109 RepID=UPI000F0EEA0A|nr:MULTISPECIES: histidine phosphatase family protein [unclassified Ketobacter]RLT88691.1 MAG: histidine phosphatase family protein [Ketobacter sp. GenoA1]RLT97708.1 MAG: histidine phosphatase family protein [Ketobacter sp.]
MKTIFLIRHGEAAASWDDNPDPELSDGGYQQAKSLVGVFSTATVSHIYSSPMLRAQQTAKPLALARNLSISVDDAFREIPTPVNIPVEKRVAWLKRCADRSWQEMDSALSAWRERIIARFQELPDNTAVFTHFMVMNAVFGFLQGSTRLVAYQPGHCSVLTLGWRNGRWCIVDAGRQSPSPVL